MSDATVAWPIQVRESRSHLQQLWEIFDLTAVSNLDIAADKTLAGQLNLQSNGELNISGLRKIYRRHCTGRREVQCN